MQGVLRFISTLRILKVLLFSMLVYSVPAAIAQSCEDPDSTMVWKITGVPAEIYLMGSIHVGKPELYPLDAIVEELFRSADKLVFEVDPTILSQPSVALDIQRRGMLPAGETLADHVSATTMEELQAILAEFGMPAQLVMQMQPWLVINVLSSLQIVELGLLPQLGTENYILLSKAPNAEILELESLDDQLGYLSSMNSEVYLKQTLDSFGDNGVEMLNNMLDAWNCADHDRLQQIMNAEYNDADMDEPTRVAMDALEETLLYSRNEIMADVINSYIEAADGRYFVIVGAAHLLGERSIIDLLENQGYTLEAVRQP